MLTEKTTPNQKHRREWAITLALLAILLAGAAFRFYNVNWDKGTYHIHPDERSTTMVITRIQWPESLGQYFDTSTSPLNPRNVDMVYFYGTLPLFLTKFVASQMDAVQTAYADTLPDPGAYLAEHPAWTGYDQIHLVGRVLSGLFDLGTVLLTFFLARRLFDWRVGLAASFLLAFTVLNVQGSHYFAVDTFLTFFVTLTMWYTLDVAEGKGWPGFVGLGLTMGLTMACKVSVFLLVAVVALGAWIGLRRRLARGQGLAPATTISILGLVLAMILAFGVFRVAQPYAFAGPNYDRWDSVPDPWGERLRAIAEPLPEPVRAVFLPNPQWIADIVSAGAQQTGEADLPWGRQWTERTPWLWPLENMVKWTLGVPLGLAAWLGVGLAVVQLIRLWRRRRHGEVGNWEIGDWGLGHWSLVILPLTWVLLSFFWQGMQYVKSVRYFMPIHPFLAAFAAFLVVRGWDWARTRQRWLRIAAGALAGFVLLGTLAWALAFIQIYTEPVTRVQATRWMYENIPSAATLRYRTADGETGQYQIPLPSSQVYPADGQWLINAFTPPQDLIATEVVMNKLTGLDGPSDGIFEVGIASQYADEGLLADTQIVATFGGEGGQRHVLNIPDVELTGGQTYYLQSRALRGAPLIAQGSAIANEHFDDPLPFNMDGRIAFGSGQYIGLDLTLYDEDTPEKLDQLLDVLDQADYISMSSGRLWQSIPRLPMRYPVTTRYYQLLFAGELGFQKVAEFHSYPRLFGIEFDDTWAEEQFTVYDHPKVLIYQKTADYDRERVRALLSAGIDWDNIPHWLNPRDVPKWRREQAQAAKEQESIETKKNDLMLTDEQRQIQEAGGTWASIFDRNSLPNRWPTASWLVLLAVVGLAALPLTVGILHSLPDRGYILARPVGVLLLAWLSWMLTNVTPLHYSRGTILLALGLITAGSWATLLLPGQRRRLAELWRTQKRLILINEALFLAFFAAFWFIRWGNPDLWHPWKGGEKPMDFAYLNAVIKSTEFPPYDPWFAGGYLNYYYFGQVMVGTLIKLIGIVPNVAYNLVIPTWFAMTALGAFSVTYNLVAGRRVGNPPYKWALVGALFVAVLGNLGEIHLLLLKLAEGMMDTFQSTIPGLAGLVRVVVGTFEVLFGGRALPIRIDEWYWNASRAIPSAPGEAVITEFPFFTFLYADLHAHLIAMPLTFLSLSAAIAVVVKGARSKMQDARSKGGVLHLASCLLLLVLWALTIGAMRTTNTWDVPPHLLLALGALSIGAWARRTPGWRGWLGLAASVIGQFVLLAALGWSLLYRPFWMYYGSYYDKILPWEGTRTPIWAYLVVHGLFLFAIVSFLVVDARRHGFLLRRVRLTFRYSDKLWRLQRAARFVGVKRLPVRKGLLWLAVALFVLAELFFLTPNLIPCHEGLPDPAAGFWANLNLGKSALLPCTTPLPGVEAGAYDYRGLGVFAVGLPAGLLALLLLLRPRLSPTQRLWALLVLLGLAMSLGVEVIVLEGDIARMNTVFKFYLQVWLMWGVAAAAALAWLVPHVRRWHWGRKLWLGALAVLVFCAALYPLLATPAKIRDRFDPDRGPELDGWAYMETSSYADESLQYDLKWDLQAIRWLLDNVVGSPVILEGQAPEYRWGARYAINTGLPTVLGWNWHQRQQRAAAGDEVVWQRAADVALIYNTPSPDIAQALLDEYHVRYIVVGPLEKAYYDPQGLDKFEQMATDGTLAAVYSNQEVTIYEVLKP
jgi:YYY domain-containing protein